MCAQGQELCRSLASDSETGNTRERQKLKKKKKKEKVSSSYRIYVAYMQCAGEIVSCKLKSNKNLTRVKSKKEMTLSHTRKAQKPQLLRLHVLPI